MNAHVEHVDSKPRRQPKTNEIMTANEYEIFTSIFCNEIKITHGCHSTE